MELRAWVLILLIAALPLVILYARQLEKMEFNKGYCKHCNSLLRRFDTDSQGGRGYVCDKCGFHVWASYKVDKNFEMQKAKK